MEYKNKQIADILYNKILEECNPIKEIADKLSDLAQKINKEEKIILQQNEAGDYLAQVIKPKENYQRGLPCDISDGSVISEYYF